MQEISWNVFSVYVSECVSLCVCMSGEDRTTEEWFDSMNMNGQVVQILSAAPMKPYNHVYNWLSTFGLFF